MALLTRKLGCNNSLLSRTVTVTFALLTFGSLQTPEGVVRPCAKYEDGESFRCLKEVAGANGDNFGRVGIINKSQCLEIRFMKQEWSLPCGVIKHPNATLIRAFPGEVLKYGDFQVDMVQDFIQLGSCGEMRIKKCYCGSNLVKCGDVLWVATYKRGEHAHLLEKFHLSQRLPSEEEIEERRRMEAAAAAAADATKKCCNKG